MSFILTTQGDEAEITVKTRSGEFSITVGTIPDDIGEKIDTFMIQAARHYREKIVQEINTEDVVDVRKASREANLLLCKYGIRGHSGLKNHQGKDMPCKLSEDEQGRTILHEDTLRIYRENTNFVELCGGYVERIRQIGVGRYIVEGDKVIDRLNGDNPEDPEGADDGEGQPVDVPFSQSSDQSSENSTQSASGNATP